MWWMAAMGAMQIASGAMANREAKETARQNARYIEMEGAEQLRRMDREQVFRMGDAMVQSGAGGLMLGGSTERALNNLQNEYLRQRAWTKSATHQQARVARGGGNLVGVDSAIQGVGNVMAAYGSQQPAGKT